MKVLFVAPEVPPHAKVGGLADVVGALSKALVSLGHECKIFCPLYGDIKPGKDWHSHPSPLPIVAGDHVSFGRLWECTTPDGDVDLTFLEFNDYFGRCGIYGPADNGDSFGDNGHRFAFFCRAALDLCHHLEWYPQIIHCHDWTTGLIPAMLKLNESKGPLSGTSTVLTLHNLEHQGVFPQGIADFAGLAGRVPMESGQLNFLGTGIRFATNLTTVSPTYSREIQGTSGGCGMEKILKRRSVDLCGILNGIDTQVWNPASDSALPGNFSMDDLAGKALCREELLKEMGLPSRKGIPLFGVVSRLYQQKGLDLLAEALPSLLTRKKTLQVVVLGSGDPSQEKAFQDLERKFPEQVATATRFDESLARRIYAGSDFFLMPSRFEPCGLSQLYAMRYGTIPIVRRTGGLADTVHAWDGKTNGNGILFGPSSVRALLRAMETAVMLFDDPSAMQIMQQNGMSEDFSWDKPALQYQSIYVEAQESRLNQVNP